MFATLFFLCKICLWKLNASYLSLVWSKIGISNSKVDQILNQPAFFNQTASNLICLLDKDFSCTQQLAYSSYCYTILPNTIRYNCLQELNLFKQIHDHLQRLINISKGEWVVISFSNLAMDRILRDLDDTMNKVVSFDLSEARAFL